MMATPYFARTGSATIGGALEAPFATEKFASRSRSRSTSVGSSPGSDIPSVSASSPDCPTAVPIGPPGVLCLHQHIEALPSFNLPTLRQNLTLDACTNAVKASALGIAAPPGLEDVSPLDERADDDSLAWVVASTAAEAALETPVAKMGNLRLESDIDHFTLLRAPPAPACLPPPPLQPPILNHTATSLQFTPPQQPPILATQVRCTPVVPPPSWSPPRIVARDQSEALPPPLQPPLLSVPVASHPVAPPPLQAPVLGLEVLASVEVPPPVKAPVLRLAEVFSLGDSQAPALPAAGSVGHNNGTCKPCAFLYTKGCSNGSQCAFCHLCGPGEKKRRMKEKRALLREA